MSTTPDSAPPSGASPGPGVDRYGRDVIDPTQNVLDLVQAAIKRQDDLREAAASHQRELGEIRESHAQEMRLTARRYEDRLDAKNEQIRQAETARIDAIRLVDVGAVNRAAEVQAAQQAALAAQLVATADASRAQVAAAAAASVTSLAAALEPIQKDIRDLRDAQSRGAGGKEQVAETRDVRQDSRLTQGQLISYALLVVAVLSLILLYATKK